MPPPSHDDYLNALENATTHTAEPTGLRDTFRRYAHAVQVLLNLDLEPARPTLASCYADRRRGSPPRDPVVMLRVLLLAILVKEPSLNRWVRTLRTSAPLRALAGLDLDDSGPGVGTLYDFLHRLHNGPAAYIPGVEPASLTERRRSRTLQAAPPKRKHKKKKKTTRRGRRKKKEEVSPSNETLSPEKPKEVRSAIAVVEVLRRAPDAKNPNDLLGRLSTVLFELAVKPSAERGLLGDTSKLVIGGDGSTLPTGAQGRGTRTCDHNKFERCTCDRLYADPDARIGWDTHRRAAFFGYRFYEVSVSTKGHDLPLALRLDPANLSDFVAGPRCIDHLRRTLRDHSDGAMRLDTVTLDAGHDAKPIYEWFGEHHIKPVIPLSGEAPATAPGRPNVSLSTKGIPQCKAGVEMGPWGSAGRGRTNFICPLKTGLARCPLASEDNPSWRCRPDLTFGPTISLKTSDNPRLFPSIQRNSRRFAKLRRLRSGTERSNGAKKGPYKLLEARHRRSSFWLIRLHLIAILQHAKAWAADIDDEDFVEQWLERSMASKAA